MIAEINREERSDQEVWDGGQSSRPDTRILELDHVPEVRVRLELSPPAATQSVTLAVASADGTPVAVPNPLSPNPFATRWRAGVYHLGAVPPTVGIVDDLLPVIPPVFPWRAEVSG